MFQELKCNGKAVKTLLRSAQHVWPSKELKQKLGHGFTHLAFTGSQSPGGCTCIPLWPIWGCAAGQDMVFVLSVLNRVYNFV